MFCHFHYFEVRFWNACETCQNWKIDRKSLTCSLMARSSAIRFLEFINAWPHWGQSTSLWLHLWHNKWPSGHWYIGGLSAVSKHTGHSRVFSKSLILASVWNTKSGFRLHFQFFYNTVFENHSKMSHLNFSILAFSTNFCPMKINLSGNTVWPQASVFLKLAKLAHFCLLTLNINLARFARNVKWDFSIIFKHCVPILSLLHRGIFVWLEVSCVPSGKLHLSLFGGLEMALHRFSSQFVENSALQYEIFCWEKKPYSS